MSERKNIVINFKAILWDASCVLSFIAAASFGILWKNATTEAENAESKTAELQQEKKSLINELNKNAEQYNKAIQSTTEALSNNDDKIGSLQAALDELNIQKRELQLRWRSPLISSLDIAQEIYAMKWEVNSPVLNDMENHSARTLTICEKWEDLCSRLSPYPEIAPQIAKLRIRLAQAYSSLGLVDRIDLTTIDWQASQMEEQKPEIEVRIWFNIASQMVNSGKLTEAQQYLEKAQLTLPQIKTTPDRVTYFSAMMTLLQADIIAPKDPKKSLELYTKATDNLSQIVASMPENIRLKNTFAQACLEGSLLREGGTSAGQHEQLKKHALKKVSTLLKDNPKLKHPQLLSAETKIQQAEEMLRKGEQYKASELLQLARNHIKSAGGDVLLSASVDGSQAFIHWDHGERTKAMKIIDAAISKVQQFKQEAPTDTDASYRLASLYWVRSAMQISPADSISDGQKSVQLLVKIVQQGASKREASARRMIAIIYGDIGYQAYISNQKAIAKQYFQQAQKQWSHLIKNWGTSDEYKEGERWCQRKIDSL